MGLEGQVFPSSNSTSYHDLYSHVYSFESSFDQFSAQSWTQAHWVPLCTVTGAAYVTLVFTGQSYMSSRAPFHLRGALATWSALLAAFSMMGFSRTAPELLNILREGGVQESVCNPSYMLENKVTAFWTWLFVLSKLPELGDTAFIVLRKQKLIFLHWYHHLSVLIYVFYTMSEFTSSARWFMVMNFFVHALMYSYYTLRALRIRVPPGVAPLITSLQLLQMAVGCTINFLSYNYKSKGIECSQSYGHLTFGFFIYASYFVLFAKFFYAAYFSGAGRKGKESPAPAGEGKKEM